MKISQLKNKKIAIVGLGIEGMNTYLFLRKNFPQKKLVLADKRTLSGFDDNIQKKLKKDKYLDLFLGSDYLKNLKDAEVVIKTSGMPLLSISKFLARSAIVTSQIELFLDNCPSKIIAITGTKGKSTTSSIIYSMLKEAKIKTYLLGNIGTAALSFLEKVKKTDIVVLELSAHQLYSLKKSPDISIFLNIYPEHLDYYKDFKEYFLAKANIALHQKKNDYFIYNPEMKEIKSLAKKVISKKIPIDPKKFKNEIKKINQNNITHDFNIAAILELAKILKIPNDTIEKTFRRFKPLAHRLEFIGEYKGIRFYDDSIATIPEAVIFALDTLGPDVETLIAGGLNRGIKFDKIAKRIINSNIKNLILFPDSGIEIRKEIENIGKRKDLIFFETQDMEKAVDFAFKNTQRGNICLLSPASPSFNLFKDYQERGNAFKKEITNNK
ncbi:MAG: UDP-N-acetylmuramoyl-L-alanine--D-glutamate ligase [Candidatus Paceibacterota bacterium]